MGCVESIKQLEKTNCYNRLKKVISGWEIEEKFLEAVVAFGLGMCRIIRCGFIHKSRLC